MKLLLENWRKFLNEEKLRVFDFDDTLAMTDSEIILVKSDGSKENLTPAEYAVYEPQQGDQFDFSQFQGDLINPREVKKITKVFRRVLDSGLEGRKVAILTARDSKALPGIKSFIKDMGYDPGQIEIITLGSSNPNDKSAWIDSQIRKGYKDIYFVDDSHKNIEAVNALKDKYKQDREIKIRTQPVD